MNKELYKCDIDSEPSKRGFMKRLKSLWDLRHPEINLSAKHLNEQAKRIERKNLIFIAETGDAATIDYPSDGQDANASHSNALLQQSRSAERLDPRVIRISARDLEEHAAPTQPTSSNLHATIERPVEQRPIDTLISQLWEKNMATLRNLPLAERTYLTKVSKRPSADILDDLELKNS